MNPIGTYIIENIVTTERTSLKGTLQDALDKAESLHPSDPPTYWVYRQSETDKRHYRWTEFRKDNNQRTGITIDLQPASYNYELLQAELTGQLSLAL